MVLDAVGKSSFSQCKRLLKPCGIYISSELGPLAQNPFLALIAPLHGGKKVLFPIPKHDQLMVRYVRELIESGEFKPVIDRTYPLDQIVEAYRYVETGQKPAMSSSASSVPTNACRSAVDLDSAVFHGAPSCQTKSVLLTRRRPEETLRPVCGAFTPGSVLWRVESTAVWAQLVEPDPEMAKALPQLQSTLVRSGRSTPARPDVGQP